MVRCVLGAPLANDHQGQLSKGEREQRERKGEEGRGVVLVVVLLRLAAAGVLAAAGGVVLPRLAACARWFGRVAACSPFCAALAIPACRCFLPAASRRCPRCRWQCGPALLRLLPCLVCVFFRTFSPLFLRLLPRAFWAILGYNMFIILFFGRLVAVLLGVRCGPISRCCFWFRPR